MEGETITREEEIRFPEPQRWPLNPTREQRAVINQQLGNLRILRNHYLKARSEYTMRYEGRMSREDYNGMDRRVLLHNCPFLEGTDFLAEDCLVEGLESALTRLEEGETVPFPAIATPENPEGNRYITRIRREDLRLSGTGSGAVLLPCIGEVTVTVPGDAPFPDAPGGWIPVCVLREGMEYSLVFPTMKLRRAYWRALAKRTAREDPARYAKIRKKIRRLAKELTRKERDPVTGKLSNSGKQCQQSLEKERRHLQNMMYHDLRQAANQRGEEEKKT